MKKAKRIAAIVALVFIALWIIATIFFGVTNFPFSHDMFCKFMIGCVMWPIIAWILIWMFGVITNTKTIASYRSKEMDETMRKADEIRAEMERAKEEKEEKEEQEENTENE